MARAKASDVQDTTQAVDVAGWKAAAVHKPLLPSGVRVGLRIPNLSAMIETGAIPQHLLSAALGIAQAQLQDDNKVPTTEEITDNAKQDREFTDLITLASVVEPKLTEDDLGEEGIPVEDKQFIVALATRQRDLDAEGEHIAGLMKSEKFRRFRRLGEFDPDVEGL